jgi:hypothetical protein
MHSIIQREYRRLCSVQIAQGYEAGGAACLSVLTDNRYFQGRFEFLSEIRDAGVSCPLLCKEVPLVASKARPCTVHDHPAGRAGCKSLGSVLG